MTGNGRGRRFGGRVTTDSYRCIAVGRVSAAKDSRGSFCAGRTVRYRSLTALWPAT